MHLPPLVQDLAVILGVAAIITFLFRLGKQPLVLAYIFAGVLVGPYSIPALSVVDVSSVKVWAELGVIFLMFALGLEFSFRRLAKVGLGAALTAVIAISIMLVLGYTLAKNLGFSPIACFFVGAMLAISSTTIIVKTLSELGLKTRRFAELVFGMLIVEDLAAIMIIVALTNVATSDVVNWASLLLTAGKLLLVVGAWLILGLFLIPKLTRAVKQRGNDEMLLIMSLGLCLALVSLSAYFSYSAALGAFVMGAIIAETREAKRVESLLSPLKDLFGAIFFVSVGMLLQPEVILDNWPTIVIMSLTIITGKACAVGLGAIITGQSIRTAIHASFTMAQIGEFSFIIATLGLSYQVIDRKLYPIIVAASLITTFTTPYMIHFATPISKWLETNLPSRFRMLLNNYEAFIQRQNPDKEKTSIIQQQLFRWSVNAILVVIVFVISGEEFLPALETRLDSKVYPNAIAWFTTFFASLPFIWAMFTSFTVKSQDVPQNIELKGANEPRSQIGAIWQFLGQLASIALLAFVSTRFLPAWLAATTALLLSTILFFLFKKQIESYSWFEKQFLTGISDEGSNSSSADNTHHHLIPWDAHLAEIKLTNNSKYLGKTLKDAKIREKFSINLVVIRRGDDDIVAPGADERLFPGDCLLCFGSDDDLETFRTDMLCKVHKDKAKHETLDYGLRALEIKTPSPATNFTIREAKIKEVFGCLIVGIERAGTRIANPDSNTHIKMGDLIWLVGDHNQLDSLQNYLQPEN